MAITTGQSLIPIRRTRVGLIAVALLALIALATLPYAAPAHAEQPPGLPAWLSIAAEERYRVEVMNNSFRRIDSGSDQMTSSRLLLSARVDRGTWFAGAEFQDSCAWWHYARTPVGTDDVNAAEWLQAYVGLRWQDVFRSGDRLSVTAGRMTLGMSNKRIVGRNAYRNTVNGFKGVRLAWESAGNAAFQAFYTLPLERLPNNLQRDRLLNNKRDTDESTSDRVFWGLELSRLPGRGDTEFDLYIVGFREHDRPSLPALRRDVYTAGLRAFDTRGPWQWEVELSGQWGSTRSASAAPQRSLDIRAGRVHAEVSRGFEAVWSPRVVAKYDYSSGDSDASDGKQERFEATFAARRRDFGLLGIYGPLFYANLNSAAIGLELLPAKNLRVTSHVRVADLAERGDIFVGGSLRDRTGESGRRLGAFWDCRLDWTLIPGRATLSLGGAYLDKGRFLKTAPGAPDNGDTVYGFTQIVLTL